MPATSKAQQRLMAAAEHGATFPKAKKLRASMTHQQLHDFASGSMAGKPAHAAKKKPDTQSAAYNFRAQGHPHKNLGRYLHKRKAS